MVPEAIQRKDGTYRAAGVLVKLELDPRVHVNVRRENPVPDMLFAPRNRSENTKILRGIYKTEKKKPKMTKKNAKLSK